VHHESAKLPTREQDNCRPAPSQGMRRQSRLLTTSVLVGQRARSTGHRHRTVTSNEARCEEPSVDVAYSPRGRGAFHPLMRNRGRTSSLSCMHVSGWSEPTPRDAAFNTSGGCSGRLAPMMGAVMAGFSQTQAIARVVRECRSARRSVAAPRHRGTRARASDDRQLLSRKRQCVAACEPQSRIVDRRLQYDFHLDHHG
jgi:hypothetical protein